MEAEKDIQEDLEYYADLPYNISIERWDDGSGPYWVARVVELPGCIIHGDTPQGALEEIEGAKRDWIKSNLERGLKIPEPVRHNYSGKIILRISPVLHETLAHRAEMERVSLNKFMTMALAEKAGVSVVEKSKK